MQNLVIGIGRERAKDETRVALSPQTVKQLVERGVTLLVEKDAGTPSGFLDCDYAQAGAQIESAFATIAERVDVLLGVAPPTNAQIAKVRQGALLIASLGHEPGTKICDALNARQITALSLERIPRVTRAQSMDTLSSQANLAGYRAVVDAAALYDRALPMMITAAGTVPAARVFVMGAGVAGLQAIATARRLGAIVSATDVRPAAKEQVASLGAKFIAVEDEEFRAAETAGGYAKEMSQSYREKQTALVTEHIGKQDIVITTALIPGKPAPKLITESMVDGMKAGSIIVDLAAERGGNCTLCKADHVVEHKGVRIVGFSNWPARIAGSASALFARNLCAFLDTVITENLDINIDPNDEIVGPTLVAGPHSQTTERTDTKAGEPSPKTQEMQT